MVALRMERSTGFEWMLGKSTSFDTFGELHIVLHLPKIC